jgi:hypothetical protein
MQVKFAYAASGSTNGGVASIGVAAWAVAAPANQTAAIVTFGHTAQSAASSASLNQDNENNKLAAPQSSKHKRPVRQHRQVRSRTPAPAILPTRIGRARASACRHGGTFSASVLPAAQAALEIGATILAGGVRAGKGMPSAPLWRRHRVGWRADSMPAGRPQGADFAEHGEARVRTLAPVAARAVSGAKQCAASIEVLKTLKATSAAHANARRALVTLGAGGSLRDGAITLHDFKDSVRAVLDVVEV